MKRPIGAIRDEIAAYVKAGVLEAGTQRQLDEGGLDAGLWWHCLCGSEYQTRAYCSECDRQSLTLPMKGGARTATALLLTRRFILHQSLGRVWVVEVTSARPRTATDDTVLDLSYRNGVNQTFSGSILRSRTILLPTADELDAFLRQLKLTELHHKMHGNLKVRTARKNARFAPDPAELFAEPF
jgi:hypothetical protein